MSAVDAVVDQLASIEIRSIENATQCSEEPYKPPGPPASETIAGLDTALQSLQELISEDGINLNAHLH